MKVLLTGATGYIGKELFKRLFPEVEKVYLLVRKHSLHKVVDNFHYGVETHLVQGDITRPQIFDCDGDCQHILEEVDVIVHAAALYDLQGSFSKCYRTNLLGTQNILYWAKKMKKLRYFHYLSTVAVAGDLKGNFGENDFDCGQKFFDHYAKTKFLAEKYVREFKECKVRIYRLGIVVGNSQTGEISKIDGPYYFLKVIENWKKYLPGMNYLSRLPLPFNKETIVPLICVDQVANYLAKMILNPQGEEQRLCYHVFDEQSPLMKEFVLDILENYKLRPKLIELPRWRIGEKLLEKIGLPSQLFTYSYSLAKFDQKNFLRDLPEPIKNYPEYKKIFHLAENEL